VRVRDSDREREKERNLMRRERRRENHQIVPDCARLAMIFGVEIIRFYQFCYSNKAFDLFFNLVVDK
jgi:hypothetical protein